MKRYQYLQRRLRTLNTLHDAVGALRSLSAHHFRVCRQALIPAREYRRQIERVIAAVGIQQPPQPKAPTGLVVVASDLGLCGDYNSRLSELAAREAHQHGAERLYSVGRRSRSILARSSGLVLAKVYDAPASLEGLTRLLLQLSQDLFEDYVAQRIGQLFVVAAQFDGVGHFTPNSTRVLPIEPVAPAAPLRRSPYVDARHLMAVAVREFLFITLHQIFLDALAAEHGMRLTSTEGALQWLENTSSVTSRQLATSRSENATQELLDIIAGGRKLRSSIA
jgi:ATP synthase F1 gamma subunit